MTPAQRLQEKVRNATLKSRALHVTERARGHVTRFLKGVSRSELAHTLDWYAQAYGLAYNTCRKYRNLLDDPRALFKKLMGRRRRRINLATLAKFIRANCYQPSTQS